MLRKMRAGALSGVFLVFLLLGGVGLVLSDTGGFFRGSVPTGAIANVAGEKISIYEFDQRVRQLLNRQNINVQNAYESGFIQRILDSEIERVLFQKASVDYGIILPDIEVARELDPVLESVEQSGLSKSEALDMLARQYGMPAEDIFGQVRLEMSQRLIQSFFDEQVQAVNPHLAAAIYRNNNEHRTVNAIILNNDSVNLEDTIEEEELRQFYENTKLRYEIEESRRLRLAYLEVESLADNIELSEQELRQLYEDRKDDFFVPETRLASQAILPDIETAQNVVENVESGQTLQDAVSDVAGQDELYSPPEKFERRGLQDEISEPLFNAEKGQTIGPIQTVFGWHVMTVEEIEEPKTLPFEEVRENLHNQYKSEQAIDIVFETINAIEDALASGQPFDNVVSNHEMELHTTGAITRGGNAIDPETGNIDTSASPLDPISNREDRAYILETAYTLPEGEISQVLETDDGKIVITQVEQINAPRFRPFEDVKDNVRARLQDQKKAERNRQNANAYLERLQKEDITLETLAKKNGKPLSVFKDIGKTAESSQYAENLNWSTRQEIFNAEKDSFFVAPSVKGFIVGKVTAISMPAKSDIPEDQIGEIRATLAERLRTSYRDDFINYLYGKYKVNVNYDVLSQIYSEGSLYTGAGAF